MNLLKQLMSIREGAVKDAVMDTIETATRKVVTTGLSYEEAVTEIAKYVKEHGSRDLFHDDSLEAIKDLVRTVFEPNDLTEASDEDTSNRLLAKADEFRVEIDDNEQVHLLDGEGTIRVSMPYVIWKQLSRQ